MDFSYVHIRYFIGYVYHMCLQDTIQSTLSLCLRCQAMLLPMPLRPLLLTTGSGFNSTQFIHQCDQNFNDSQMYISAVNFPLVFMFFVRRQMSPVSARRVAFVFRDFPI